MLKFIKLTEQGNDKINYVNVNSIAIICNDDDGTIVKIKEDWFYFKESPEEVIKLIEEKK